MKIMEWIYRVSEIAPALQIKLLLSGLIVGGLRIVLTVLFLLLQRVKDTVSRYDLKKIAVGMVVFIGIMLLGRVWFPWFGTWVVFIGIILGAVIVALKEVLFDLAGWFYLVWRRPLEIGDWVAVGEITGEVFDLGRLQFSLLETSRWEEGKLRSGRIVHVPNGRIFRDKLVNYSKGYHYAWNEFTVRIALDSNWQQAKELLRRIVNRYIEAINRNNEPVIQQATAKHQLFYAKLAPEVYTRVVGAQIELTTRFLCEPDKRRITMHAIWEDVLREFTAANDIKFVYAPVLEFLGYQENIGAALPGSGGEVGGGAGIRG
jgi:small-conductance mechanosensitive channel